MVKFILIGLLFLFPISSSQKDPSYKLPEQRELYYCMQGENRCVCCDAFFHTCRKGTLFTWRGECEEINAFIYELRYRKKQQILPRAIYKF